MRGFLRALRRPTLCPRCGVSLASRDATTCTTCGLTTADLTAGRAAATRRAEDRNAGLLDVALDTLYVPPEARRSDWWLVDPDLQPPPPVNWVDASPDATTHPPDANRTQSGPEWRPDGADCHPSPHTTPDNTHSGEQTMTDETTPHDADHDPDDPRSGVALPVDDEQDQDHLVDSAGARRATITGGSMTTPGGVTLNFHTTPPRGRPEVHVREDWQNDTVHVILRRPDFPNGIAYAHVDTGHNPPRLTDWRTSDPNPGGVELLPMPGIDFRRDDAEAIGRALADHFGGTDQVKDLEAQVSDLQERNDWQANTIRESSEREGHLEGLLAEARAQVVGLERTLAAVERHLATLEALAMPAKWVTGTVPEGAAGPESFQAADQVLFTPEWDRVRIRDVSSTPVEDTVDNYQFGDARTAAALRRVARERTRQQDQGWTREHDRRHTLEEWRVLLRRRLDGLAADRSPYDNAQEVLEVAALAVAVLEARYPDIQGLHE